MDCSRQAPLSMEFSMQEYWSGSHALLLGIFLTRGLNPGPLNCRQILYYLRVQGSPAQALSVCVLSRSVMSDSLQQHGLQPGRLLCPWDSPGKNTGVGCHALLQGIFLTQGVEPEFPALQGDSLPAELPGKPAQALQILKIENSEIK